MLQLALSLLLCSAPTTALASTPSAAEVREPSTRERFVELHAAKDEAGCEALWREHPHEVLYVIDEDLEGALATWEKSPDKPDSAAIEAHHARALWGAAIASRVSGHPIFLDYATGFASFDAAQKKAFRGGQKAHGASRAAAKAKKWADAQKSARECIELAAPLGDWWGHAMGLSALGSALAADGKPLEALAPLAQAALIYHDLQLVGDECAATSELGRALAAAGAKARAKVVLGRAIELSARIGNDKNKAALEAELAKLGE